MIKAAAAGDAVVTIYEAPGNSEDTPPGSLVIPRPKSGGRPNTESMLE